MGRLQLKVPFRTADSVVLVWDKQAPDISYDIEVNGELRASCTCTDFTVTDLMPDTEYAFTVRTGNLVETVRVRTGRRSKVLDVTDFGARDGELCTEALQRAIDQCPIDGEVRIPAGTYQSGALYLKSHMTLRLEKGATLLGSSRAADYSVRFSYFEGREEYCYSSLLHAEDSDGGRLEDIAIVGEGTIDANGSALMKEEIAEGKASRGRAICAVRVDGLYLNGITVCQSPAWCIHTVYCNNVTMNQITVRTKYDAQGRPYEGIYNGDGIDPDSCKDVWIIHSVIASQDDCIAIKSGRDAEGRRIGIPSENIPISNCRFLSGFGVAIGSEMSGGVRHVLVQDCTFTDTFSVASVKNQRGRGNCIEDVLYEDLVFVNTKTDQQDTKWFRGGIYVDQFYGCEPFDDTAEEPVDEGTPVIRNITFRNIQADTVVSSAIYMVGLPEQPLENIRLENVQASGRWGMRAANIRGLVMENTSVTAREGEAFRMDRVE